MAPRVPELGGRRIEPDRCHRTAGTGDGIVLGTFLATQTPLNDQIHAEVFDFSLTHAQSIRMDILSNNGSIWTAISEVAFRKSSIPEPSSFVLMTAIFAGMLLHRKKTITYNSLSFV